MAPAPPPLQKKKGEKNTNHKFYGFGLRLFHLLGFGDVKAWKISGADSCYSNDDILVGGFNPCEKNVSNWTISPGRDENKK